MKSNILNFGNWVNRRFGRFTDSSWSIPARKEKSKKFTYSDLREASEQNAYIFRVIEDYKQALGSVEIEGGDALVTGAVSRQDLNVADLIETLLTEHLITGELFAFAHVDGTYELLPSELMQIGTNHVWKCDNRDLPAGTLIRHVRRARIGDARGTSPLSAALEPANELARLDGNLSANAELASKFQLVYRKGQAQSGFESSDKLEIDGGELVTINEGSELEYKVPSLPNTDFLAFRKQLLVKLGVALKGNQLTLTGDLALSNYSSSRSELMQFNASAKRLADLVYSFIQRISTESGAGDMQFKRRDFVAGFVDSGRRISAIVSLYKEGIITQDEAIELSLDETRT